MKKIPASRVEYNTSITVPFTDDTDDPNDDIPNTLLGSRITRCFNDGYYIGTITDTWHDSDTGTQFWTIRYDDDDTEDLDFAQLNDALDLYKLYPQEYRFPVDNDDTRSSTSSSTASPSPSASTNRVDFEEQPAPPSPTPPPTNVDNATTDEPPTSNTTPPPRRSARIRDRLTRAVKATTLAAMGVTYFLNSNVQPVLQAQLVLTQAYTNPTVPDVSPPLEDEFFVNLIDESVDHIDELRAYHSQVDRLNSILSPNDYPPPPSSIHIHSHHVRPPTSDAPRRIMMVTTDTSSSIKRRQLHSLNDLRIDVPWECIAYDEHHNLRRHPEWNWIDDYIASDTMFAKIVHTYRASKLGESTFQYGVKVPKPRNKLYVLMLKTATTFGTNP